jgi:hypothetical protein
MSIAASDGAEETWSKVLITGTRQKTHRLLAGGENGGKVPSTRF